jgi:hypothetical protein
MNTLSLPLYWQNEYFEQFHSRPIVVKNHGFLSHWFLEEKTLKSGFSAPFGGFWPITKDISEMNVGLHIETVEELGASLGSVEELQVRILPSELYANPEIATFENLKSLGFVLNYTEIDHVVDLCSDWFSKWNRNRKRDLKNNDKILSVEEVVSDEYFQVIRNVIETNRSSKGLKSNIDIASLKKWKSLFGGRTSYYLCTVKDTNLPVAAAICQYVSDSMVYVYKWGDDRNATKEITIHSPISNLAKFLFSEFQKRGVKKVYLGSSSKNGEIDLGLARFKESIGSLRIEKKVAYKKFGF